MFFKEKKPSKLFTSIRKKGNKREENEEGGMEEDGWKEGGGVFH